MSCKSQSFVGGVLIGLASAAVMAAPVSWNYDISTTGQDVHWLSPTAAATDAPEYDGVFDIAHVFATVRYLFITTTIEVTDQLPPEYLHIAGTFAGPPPFVVANQDVLFPPPPDPVAVAAHIVTSINAGGSGQLDVTNVQLGTYPVNLPPFGTVTVTILGVRVQGSVRVTPVYSGDVDRDGDVDLNDLSALLAAFGSCAGDPAYNAGADFDLGGCIDLGDLAQQLANFGRA